MAERYHLVLAAVALAVGVLCAASTRLGRSSGDRALAVAGLAAALLGGWGSARAVPWVLMAAVVAMTPARGQWCHPLGRWLVPMAAASAVGIWSAVPDTEAPLAVALVLLPIAVTQAVAARSTSRLGWVALMVALAGAVWVGSAGWGAALLTIVAVGMVLIAPVVVGSGGTAFRVTGMRWVLAAHLVTALALPRAIMRRSVPVAAAVVVATAVLLALIIRAAARGPGPIDEPAVRPST